MLLRCLEPERSTLQLPSQEGDSLSDVEPGKLHESESPVRRFLLTGSWCLDSASIGSYKRSTISKKCFLLLWFAFGGLFCALSIMLFLNVSKNSIVSIAPESTTPNSSFSGSGIYLNSTPKMMFRDNLIEGIKYVTAWPIEGFTNQFMSQINLIYLSGLAGRVPVLASFVPAHMKGKPNTGLLPFSDIFDLPKLASVLQRPILEWKDLKNPSSREVEEIGCWSLFKALFDHERHFQSEQDLALDVSLTKVPESCKFTSGRYDALNIMALASLGWHGTRGDVLSNIEPSPSPQHKHTQQPDDTMLCYDNLYYVGAARQFEWEYAWSPVWNLVGQHARYNPQIERLAREYVARAFGLNTSDPFPSYISVHVRRTDFIGGCHGRPVEHCFPPLSVYAAKVDEVKADIMKMHGVDVDRVLLTSDENNHTWWNDVQEMGWKRLNHEREQTEKIHGPWYPIVLDTVALSLAKGLVGTKGSTLSLIASKRVQLWESGAVRYVGLGNF